MDTQSSAVALRVRRESTIRLHPSERLRHTLRSLKLPCALPILLTLMRVACVPIFAIGFLSGIDAFIPLSAALFALASITDWLDGRLARWLGQVTKFGAFLDPIADKLLVVSALVLLSYHSREIGIVAPSLVIILRELSVSALREWVVSEQRGVTLPVSVIGKYKTAVQMISILMLLLASFTHEWVRLCGVAMLNLAAGLALLSLAQYVYSVRATIQAGIKPRDA